MQPNERLYAAISGAVPDRIPVVPKIWVDFAANYCGTPLTQVITAPQTALDILIKAGIRLGLDAVRQFHFPMRKILTEGETVYEVGADNRKIGMIDMKGGLATHLFDVNDYVLEDPFVIAYYQFKTSDEPFVRSIGDIKRIAVPDKQFYKQIGWEGAQIAAIKSANGKIALIGDCGTATLAFYVCLRGMTRAMFDLVDEPEMVHYAMEKGAAIAIERGKFNIDMGIKVLRLNDSVGNMSVISPAHWRTFIKPYMKTVCEELHRYDKNVRIYCHICGNTLPILEDLIETGLDCIAPLDPMGGFTCKQARECVGRRAALMGGVNTMSFIDNTEEEIYDEAVTCMRAAGQKGGFILGSGCVVPRGAKSANIAAIVRAAHDHGVYQNGVLNIT